MNAPLRVMGKGMAALVVAVLVVAACSGDDDSSSSAGGAVGSASTKTGNETATTTSTTAGQGGGPTTTTATGGGGTTSSATGSAPTACTSGGPAVPTGPDTSSARVTDLDGDGKPDTAWLTTTPDGKRRLGVRTAAGGGNVVDIESASPVGLTVLFADADDKPPVEVLVSDNRTVQLWAFDGCKLQKVIGSDDKPYLFDLGFRGNGTGVGCVRVNGHRQLVGLNITSNNGTDVTWSRTVIVLDGLRAHNGHRDSGTFHRPKDNDAIDLLSTVSCGDQTIDKDGLREPEPPAAN